MAAHVTLHAGKPPLQLGVSRQLSAAMVLHSGNACSPAEKGTGMPNKGRQLNYVQVTCDSSHFRQSLASFSIRINTHNSNTIFVVKEIKVKVKFFLSEMLHMQIYIRHIQQNCYDRINKTTTTKLKVN